MKYVVLSDSHDNQHNTRQAVVQAKAFGITHGFHLGDVCAPGIPMQILIPSGIQWECVFGNNDGEVEKLTALSHEHDNFSIRGAWRELEVDGHMIYITHYPDLARNAAETGKYKAVFYGHDHLKYQEIIKETLLANPGELCGLRTGEATFGVWDSETNTFETVPVESQIVAR